MEEWFNGWNGLRGLLTIIVLAFLLGLAMKGSGILGHGDGGRACGNYDVPGATCSE